MNNNITEIEIPFLPKEYNLTDGHAYRKWFKNEQKVINRASIFLKSVNRQMQFDLEKEYVRSFLKLSKQTIDFTAHKYLQLTSASLGIEIIANYLRLKNFDLALSEPCFDNLADIFNRHTIKLEPFSDEYFDNSKFVQQLEKIKSRAICLVSPNNPTGNSLTKENFLALVKFCKKNKKLLILDFCFRAYLPEKLMYDQYKILKKSKIDYILIEDTGKTYPTLELKAPFITVTNALYPQIYDIYTDLILHVSPFVIKLITEFIKASEEDNLFCLHSIIKINREVLYKHMKNTILSPIEKKFMSVAWLKVEKITGLQLKKILDMQGVHILPGNNFYWSNHAKGNHYIRIALVRDPKIFKKAAQIIGKAVSQLQ